MKIIKEYNMILTPSSKLKNPYLFQHHLSVKKKNIIGNINNVQNKIYNIKLPKVMNVNLPLNKNNVQEDKSRRETKYIFLHFDFSIGLNIKSNFII